jgi:hypothetical protein
VSVIAKNNTKHSPKQDVKLLESIMKENLILKINLRIVRSYLKAFDKGIYRTVGESEALMREVRKMNIVTLVIVNALTWIWAR